MGWLLWIVGLGFILAVVDAITGGHLARVKGRTLCGSAMLLAAIAVILAHIFG